MIIRFYTYENKQWIEVKNSFMTNVNKITYDNYCQHFLDGLKHGRNYVSSKELKYYWEGGMIL